MMNSALSAQISWILVVLLLSPVLVISQDQPFLPRSRDDCEVVDLIFILDRSWSLRSPENFQKELGFVADVVSVLDFSKSRVSVITFSDDADLNIQFNEYRTLSGFQNAIRTLPWVGGNTYTHKAIEMMLSEYNSHIQTRAGITTIGVIITDGGSTDPYKLEDVVKVVHNDRIEMYAIGVGDEVNRQELEMLASGYDHVFLLNDLNSLSTIQDKLVGRFCRGTPAPTQDQYTASCVSKSANVLVFVDDYLPQQQQYQQNLDIASDFITRLTRSIGRKHKFKLVRKNTVLTFPNIQNFMGALRSTSSRSGLSNDRNVFDIDLKSGSVNIAMIIGLPSKELFQQRSDRLATPTYIIGIKELRKDVIEQTVSSSKSFLVQNINMSTQIVKALALEMCSGCENVDLYFLLDTSNSIGPEKFQRECKMASDLIKSMGMKNGHSSITTVDYSDTPELHAYTDITQFPSLVLSKTWRGGNTMTHHALEMVLKASAGKTKSRRQVGILMSDGASTSPDRTERSALKVHKTQLEMFTIGMGEDVNVDELKMIASKPSNMFMEKSVTVDNIAQAVCNGAINDQDNEVPSNNQDCRGAFDLVFVLDSSWSLNSEKNFQKELRFVTELASDLRFDFNQASASVIIYADEAEEHAFQNGNDFMQTVLNMPWIGGNTRTDKALNILLQHVERKANSVQQDFERPLVVILISDGGSTSPFRLEEVVSRLKKYKFVKLFAIGVGVSINTKELLMIASDPSDNHMFMVDDLGVNNKILKSLLTSQICRDAKYLSLVSPTAAFSCPSHADVVFVLDSSSSLGVVGNPDVNFRKEVAFAIDVIKQGKTDFRKSRVSVITFSDVMTLNQYFNEDDLINNITRLPFLGGNTYTDIALELMLDELKYLSTISQSRKPAIGIVLTDGHSTRPELTSSMTRRIQESGFRILAIGVTSHVDMRELTEIASSPKSKNVYLLDSIDLQNSFLPSLHNNC